MEDCLLYNMTHAEYKEALSLSIQQCEIIAILADLKIQFSDTTKPGEQLIKTLDRLGFSAQNYRELRKTALTTRAMHTYYKPQLKVAVLIANDRYIHLPKLATPSVDCNSLCSYLKDLGFIAITIRNCASKDLDIILKRVFAAVPENSYFFIFYAGHGSEVCRTTCMLDTTCPAENITLDHCVTDNYLLNEVNKTKPELCILVLDMCRMYLDRDTNPKIYHEIPSIEPYDIGNISNLYISYSTQASRAAYEVLQIECSMTLDNNVTYELRPGDTDKIVPGSSQYVHALCSSLNDDLDVSSLLDKVHCDLAKSVKNQKPMKVQVGQDKRSLYDVIRGDTASTLNKLEGLCKDYGDELCTLN